MMEQENKKDFIAELKFWVAKAKEADPSFEVFGSTCHKYNFYDPISVNEVRTFEKEHNIKLPENYVRVLTELGNGGAGPYYGFYPLKKVFINKKSSVRVDNEETFFDDTLTPEKWRKAMEELDTLREDDSQYDALFQKIFANIIIIGTQGCTYDTILICAGPEYNKVVNIDWNLDEDRPPIFTHMTFEEWFLGFFKEVASGNDLDHFGYLRLGTEEELVKEYEQIGVLDRGKEERINKLRRIISSLFRFPKISNATVDLLLKNPDKELLTSLIDLIKKTDQATALSLFEKEFYGDTPELVISVCRLLPKEIFNKYYKRALEILHKPELCQNLKESHVTTLLYFISDCENKRAADIVDYAKDESKPLSLRKTAVYVMSHCPDITDYEGEMVEWMSNDDYWFALTAIQGAKKANLKGECIVKAYKWLKEEKYKEDSRMQNNLNWI